MFGIHVSLREKYLFFPLGKMAMEAQPSKDKKQKMMICPKCGRLGYYKEQSKPSGTYAFIRHIEEHYIGRTEKADRSSSP